MRSIYMRDDVTIVTEGTLDDYGTPSGETTSSVKGRWEPGEYRTTDQHGEEVLASGKLTLATMPDSTAKHVRIGSTDYSILRADALKSYSKICGWELALKQWRT